LRTFNSSQRACARSAAASAPVLSTARIARFRVIPALQHAPESPTAWPPGYSILVDNMHVIDALLRGAPASFA
jgi:hypothetical protein